MICCLLLMKTRDFSNTFSYTADFRRMSVCISENLESANVHKMFKISALFIWTRTISFFAIWKS